MSTPRTNTLLENLPQKHATRMLRMTRHARDLEIEVERLTTEITQLKAILADPNAVRLNMLHGTIAWTPETLRSVLGEPEPTAEELERVDFESWIPSGADLRRDSDGDYLDDGTRTAWDVWRRITRPIQTEPLQPHQPPASGQAP